MKIFQEVCVDDCIKTRWCLIYLYLHIWILRLEVTETTSLKVYYTRLCYSYVYQYNVTKPYLSLLVGCILDWTGIQVLNIQQSRRFTIMPTALLVLLLTKNTLFSFYQQIYNQWSARNTISRSVSIAGYIIKVKPKSNDVLNALGCQTCEVKGNTYWNDKDLFLATNMS